MELRASNPTFHILQTHEFTACFHYPESVGICVSSFPHLQVFFQDTLFDCLAVFGMWLGIAVFPFDMA